METTGNNFVAEKVNFELKKGSNTVDFLATPYLRIKNPQVTVSGEVINATCQIEVAVPGTTIGRVEICVFPDRWVRHSQNNCANDPQSYVVGPAAGTTVSLSVDPQRKNEKGELVNADEFQYKRIHYIRIAALGINSRNTSSMYNYSPVYKLENGTITEVTDW